MNRTMLSVTGLLVFSLLLTGCAPSRTAATAEPLATAKPIDIKAWFAGAQAANRVGVAAKQKMIVARPARVGEVVVSVVYGQGEETRSKPAEEGDMVATDLCRPDSVEKGYNTYLLKAATFKTRYGEALGGPDAAGRRPYRPVGKRMLFAVLQPGEGPWSFTAPWGEPMLALSGDSIVQDPANPDDTYRVDAVAFNCTYEVLEPPVKP